MRGLFDKPFRYWTELNKLCLKKKKAFLALFSPLGQMILVCVCAHTLACMCVHILVEPRGNNYLTNVTLLMLYTF